MQEDNRKPGEVIDAKLQELGINLSHGDLRDRWITLRDINSARDCKIVGIKVHALHEDKPSMDLVLAGQPFKILTMRSDREGFLRLFEPATGKEVEGLAREPLGFLVEVEWNT